MKNMLFSFIAAAVLVLPMTSCGSIEEPAKQNEVSSSSDVSYFDGYTEVSEKSDMSEPAYEDIMPKETFVTEPYLLDDEVFTKAMEYVNHNLFTSTDDGFKFSGSSKGISSDSVWYSEPFMFYETDDAEHISTSEAYAFFIIDKDNAEVIGMQMIVEGEPANGTSTGLEACYTQALRDSTPIAMVSWNRGEGFGTIFCVTDGKVISTDSDAYKLINAENFPLYYSTITPAYPSSPTE